MKVVILAGGFGTRLSEETDVRPKVMVELGGKPILWHVMKTYSNHGFNDFIICLGYKGHMIKDYFVNYYMYQSDLTVNLRENRVHFHRTEAEPWNVTLVDTGLKTMTGGRIRRIQPLVAGETFMLTYGDGVGNINIPQLLEFHKRHGKYATITAAQPVGRFGALQLGPADRVLNFVEKPKGDLAWINVGFFVLQPEIFSYLEGDDVFWESKPLEQLSSDGQMVAFRHQGFWRGMDSLRDKVELERLCEAGTPPWLT